MSAAAQRAPKKPRKKPKPRKKSVKQKRGQPSRYDIDWHPEIARGLALGGHTDVTIARYFGVTEQTLNNWKHAHPEFFESLKGGKEPADKQVENALYRSALGDEWEEVTREYEFEGKGRKRTKVLVKEKAVTKRRAPNVTAGIFWLKNRQSEKWYDRQHIMHEGSIDSPLQVVLARKRDQFAEMDLDDLDEAIEGAKSDERKE